MKAVFLPLFLMAGLVWDCNAQPTALPFQWHGQTMGLEFEQTNLATSAQIAIRDDIAYSMSLIPFTNVTFTVLAPTNSYYGKYNGFVSFSCTTPINYCEGVLCYYKTIGDVINFQLDPKACSNYIAAITLTNQQETAVNAFSDYLSQFKTGIDVSNMTLTEKKALLWNPPLMKLLEETSGNRFEELLEGAIPSVPAPDGARPQPSILAFSVQTNLPEEWAPPLLCCNMKAWRGENGDRRLSFCYVNGSWRYSPAGP